MSAKEATAPKAVDTAAAPAEPVDPSTGRIQVSGQRRRKFYVYVARRQFAAKPEVQQVHITALGSAITSAVSTAGELEYQKVGKIVKVETFYSPINPNSQRNVPRIAITVARNPEWKPEEADLQPRRSSPPESGAATEKTETVAAGKQ